MAGLSSSACPPAPVKNNSSIARGKRNGRGMARFPGELMMPAILPQQRVTQEPRITDYCCFPFVSIMNAVSKFNSSSRNSFSLNPRSMIAEGIEL